jgi:hypothetical protein
MKQKSIEYKSRSDFLNDRQDNEKEHKNWLEKEIKIVRKKERKKERKRKERK